MSLSASSQPTDQCLEQNRLFYRESNLACASKPRIQLQELADNINEAEIQYNSVRKHLDLVKALRLDNSYQEDTSSRKFSISSSCSLNSTPSERSSPREEEVANDAEPKEDEEAQDAHTDNRFQIVLTPRSPKYLQESRDDVEVPEIEVRAEKSLASIKTCKRTRKPGKSKKLPVKRVSEDSTKLSLLYSAKTKRKKLHGRLKNSNSKSTVTTRDIILPDKRPGERRKTKRQTSFDTLSASHTPQVHRKRLNLLKARELKQLDSKDFIEIYHNNKALKSGSLSVVSSRPSKIEPPQISYLQDDTAISDNGNKKKLIQVNNEDMTNVTSTHDIEYREKINDPYQAQKLKPNEYSTNYDDPFQHRNYEMPTIVSKMRQVHRPFYQRFNIRSIPFIVGTSISPSHNLGLNIQQVLNVIKMKQPTVPGISPILVQKINKGINPVSMLFEEINNEYARSCRNFNFQDNTYYQRSSNVMLNRDLGSFSCGHLHSTVANNNQAFLKQNITCEPLYEEDEESHSTNSDGRAKYQQQEKQTNPDSSTIGLRQQRQRATWRHANKCASVGDAFNRNKNTFSNNPKKNKEMMEVLNRFYNQFDKMIKQHDRLKEQLETRKDKSLLKEVSELEAALSEKEKEIKAVVDLYKEVISLKQQMKVLHELNSCVCIATPDPISNQVSRSMKVRAHTALPFNSAAQLGYGSRRSSGMCYETPHSLRLTGLLRQIQAFHRQLLLA